MADNSENGLSALREAKEGIVKYAVSGAMIDRIEEGGANVMVHGRYREHIARLSAKDYGDLKFGMMEPDDQVLAQHLMTVAEPGSSEWREFMSVRKAVRMPMEDGTGTYTVVPHIPGLLEPVVTSKDEISKGKKRVYQLIQVFSDTYVAEKYALEPRVLYTARKMAVSHPQRAAAILQEAIQEHPLGEAVRVVAGQYTRSIKQCKSTVQMMASKFRAPTAAATSAVFDRKVMIFGPDGEVAGGWHVEGPAAHMHELIDLHRMVWHVGTVEPMFLLGYELIILGIDVYNGSYYETPEIRGHVAGDEDELPVRSAADSAEILNTNQKVAIRAMTDRVLSVRDSVGKVVASSVRVTPRHTLVSDHVIQQCPDCTLDGAPLQKLRPIGRDLWVSRSDGDAGAWLLREPKLGEVVLLCYSVGSSVQYTSPMRIESLDGVNILMSRDAGLMPGMSGGAIVALTDMALLGVHCGATTRHYIGSRFGQVQYTDLMESDYLSQECRDNASDVDSGGLYHQLKSRGLGKVVDAVIASHSPVYAGLSHVGMAVNFNGVLTTTCDPDGAALTFGPDKLSYVLEPGKLPLQYETADAVLGLSEPMVTRRPNYYEKVFVVGADDDGPYFSRVVKVVQVGLAARTFSISALADAHLPLTGGLVVSLADGAVVGQYVRANATMGLGESGLCVGVPPRVAVNTDIDYVDVIKSKFTVLNPVSWPREAIDEVFMHSSHAVQSGVGVATSGNLGLAAVGDSAAKAAFFLYLRDQGVPYGEWSIRMQACQSNKNFVTLAWATGLAPLLKFGGGASAPSSSKVYADLFEAFLGAVYLYETGEIFSNLCKELGVFGDVPGTSRSQESTPKGWVTEFPRPSTPGFGSGFG